MELKDQLEREADITLARVSVDRFMGVRKFEHRFRSPVTMVIGNNAVGKSSLAAAIRGGLASAPDPLGLGPRQQKMYGNRKAASCVSLEFMGRGGSRVWSPTEGKFSGSVAHPQGKITVGIDCPFELRTDKEVNEFWDAVVKVRLGKQDILKRCKEQIAPLPEVSRKSVWNFLAHYAEQSIPDHCDREVLRELHARFKSQRSATFGAIEALCKIKPNVKGENVMARADFGMTKEQERWTLQGLDAAIKACEEELLTFSIEESGQEKVAEAQAEARRDIAAKFREADRRLKAQQDTYEIRNKAHEDQLQNLDDFMQSAFAQIAELRAAEKIHELSLKCPKCRADLFYDTKHHVLREAEEGHRVDTEQRAKAIEEWERRKAESEERRTGVLEQRKKESEALSDAKRERDSLRKQLAMIDKSIRDRENSAAEAKADGRTPISPGEYHDKMSKIWEQKETRTLVENREKVRSYSFRMQAEDLLISVLDPGGMVASQRQKGYTALSDTIASIESAAESRFDPVRIDRDGRIFIGESPHAVASKSERFWANWLVQAAFTVLYAKRRERPVMVVDEVDILDAGEMQAFGRSIAKVDELVRERGKAAQFVLFGTGAADVGVGKWNIEHKVEVVRIHGGGEKDGKAEQVRG